MLTLIIMPMISLDKLTTTMLMEEKLTSSSLLWLPDRSSWMEEPCSNRLLLEEAVVSILEEAGVILEDPKGLLEEFGSKMSAAGVITTSVATSPSGRRIWDIRKWLQLRGGENVDVPERERARISCERTSFGFIFFSVVALMNNLISPIWWLHRRQHHQHQQQDHHQPESLIFFSPSPMGGPTLPLQ